MAGDDGGNGSSAAPAVPFRASASPGLPAGERQTAHCPEPELSLGLASATATAGALGASGSSRMSSSSLSMRERSADAPKTGAGGSIVTPRSDALSGLDGADCPKRVAAKLPLACGLVFVAKVVRSASLSRPNDGLDRLPASGADKAPGPVTSGAEGALASPKASLVVSARDVGALACPDAGDAAGSAGDLLGSSAMILRMDARISSMLGSPALVGPLIPMTSTGVSALAQGWR